MSFDPEDSNWRKRTRNPDAKQQKLDTQKLTGKKYWEKEYKR